MRNMFGISFIFFHPFRVGFFIIPIQGFHPWLFSVTPLGYGELRIFRLEVVFMENCKMPLFLSHFNAIDSISTGLVGYASL